MGIFGNSKPIKDINKYCKNVGLIIIALGVLHLILSGFLSGTWGFLLIIIGIIALAYRSKTMIIIFGVALILVGTLNIINIIYEVSGIWLILGIFQIGWGIQELRRYKKTKENPKYIPNKVNKRKEKKGFVWCSLRISFWIMIATWIIISINDNPLISVIDILWIASMVFTFVVSIIHLTKYKKKAFAIVSLILSSIAMLLFLIGFFGGIMESPSSLDSSLPGTMIFNETNETILEGYYDTLSFEIYENSYLDLNFTSNNNVNLYLFEDNELIKYEQGESSYYKESLEEGIFFVLENYYITPGDYSVVIEPIENSVIYNIKINAKL